MQVTGETQGKRMWKAHGGVPWAPRASSFQRVLSWAVPSTLLLKVEKPAQRPGRVGDSRLWSFILSLSPVPSLIPTWRNLRKWREAFLRGVGPLQGMWADNAQPTA